LREPKGIVMDIFVLFSSKRSSKRTTKIRKFIFNKKIQNNKITRQGLVLRILILTNSVRSLYSFKYELLEKLIQEGANVYFCVPESDTDEQVRKMTDLGCHHLESHIERRSMNPIKDLNLVNEYNTIIKEIMPDVVLTYTIKPNIYGTYAAKRYNVPVIMTISGLGSGFNNRHIVFLIQGMYKSACKKAFCVFFQNSHDYNYFISKKLVTPEKTRMVPGSGVNLEKFKPNVKTKEDDVIRFLFIGRIMKEKGIEEYLEAADYIVSRYPNVEFQILGQFEEEKYRDKLVKIDNKKIRYLGVSYDVRNEIEKVDCIVNPSYHEGMSNVLLEGAAMGKPLIASNIPGCKEIVDDGINGFLCERANATSLITAIENFLKLTEVQREQMGAASRQKVEKNFERNIVIKSYMEEIFRAVALSKR